MSAQPKSWNDTHLTARLNHVSPGICRIELQGEMDHGSYSGLVDFTEDNLRPEEHKMLIDMSKLGFMDSSAVKYIYKLSRKFDKENLAVYNAGNDIKRILEIVGLGEKITYLTGSEEVDRWSGHAAFKKAA